MYDVVICGGGTAGCAAGYISAKNGLRTLIIEKNIHLGGSITSALVVPAMKSDTANINCEFYNEFVKKMSEYGGQITYSDGNTGWFNPEIAKIALDSMMKEAGCEVLFGCEVKDAECYDDNIKKIKISNGILSLYIESGYFIDSTGNSKLGKILNHKFLTDKKNEQPMTLRFNLSGIDMKKFCEWIMELDKDREVTTCAQINGEMHMSTAYTWDKSKSWALRPIFEAGIREGVIKEADSAYFQVFSVAGMKGTLAFNCPRILSDKELNPDNPQDVSFAVIEGREQIWRLYSFVKRYFQGFEEAYISNIADMLGVRESSRLEGEYIYSKEDMTASKTFENPVLHASYPIDIHSYKKDTSTLEKAVNDYYLPVESLKSAQFKNLYFAGRNLSATFEAQAALRIQTSCFSMGEAVAKEICKKVRK